MDALDRLTAAHDRLEQLTRDLEVRTASSTWRPDDTSVALQLLEEFAVAVRAARSVTRDAAERMRPLDRMFRFARRDLSVWSARHE